MSKILDLKKSVSELVKEFPELKETMADIGFKEILNPIALSTVGKMMTIPKGAAVKDIPMEEVAKKLSAKGFSVLGMEQETKTEERERIETLKSMIERLNSGESLESVQQDFVQQFKSVSAEEIAAAEQAIIDGGVPVSEVQQLCDVHSAMFHGANLHEESSDLENVPEGHPAKTLHDENMALSALLTRLEEEQTNGNTEEVCNLFPRLFALYGHYGKKEMLFMPVLYRHDVTGPSEVMWGVDDEIKKEVRTLAKNLSPNNYDKRKDKILAVITRIREMIYKEENIFIPLAFRFFTDNDWRMIYRDSLDMEPAFIETLPRWAEGDAWLKEHNLYSQKDYENGKVYLPTGELAIRELKGIFSLLPVDITFIDKDDILRFFVNEGKVFDRPLLALGNDVYNCHPPQVIPVIKKLLEDFKAKKRKDMEVWKTIKGKPVCVKYMAVYDETQEYVGTVEIVQDFTKAMEHFGNK